jgi:tetratricopeptide (TPR) repeat protein
LIPSYKYEPILVGRDGEINQLRRYLDSALAGKGATIFIGGEAGVGKTRLVTEFLNQAKETGVKILSGWCLSEAAVPYFPFTEVFDVYMSTISDDGSKFTVAEHLGITGWLRGPTPIGVEASRSTVKQRLGITGWLRGPERSSEPMALEAFRREIERDRTFEAVSRVLLQLSAQEPLILFLDDIHWADQLSLALLHYISKKCRNSRLLVIGTYRPEEIIPTEEKRLHPLEETMFSMSREDLLIKIELSRLKRSDFPELVRSIFRSTIDNEFVKKLYEETEGNPLFAIESLNLLIDEGYLSEKEGQWILTAPVEKTGIPSKIHDVITRRIARLGREEKQLLDLAAVCGHSFHPDTISRVVASDIADVLRTLAEIEQRHRLLSSENSTFEFTHQKIREVVYVNLPSELRRVYHLKTASCLEQEVTQRVSDSYIADLALHYVEGGAPERAFEYLVKLAEKTVDVFANLQTIEYLNTALEVTQKVASFATSENFAKIYLLRGRAWHGQGEMERAIDDFNLLMQNATSIGDESMIIEAHYWLGSALFWAGEWNESKSHLEMALEIARRTGNKFIEGRSLHFISGELIYYDLDTFDESITLLNESLRICREIGDKVTEAMNLLMLSGVDCWKGDFNLSIEKCSKALALTEETGDNMYRGACLLFLAIDQGSIGEYNEAISTAQRGLQFARDCNILYFIAPLLTTLGWIYHDLSNIELALQHHNEASQMGTIICKGDLPFLLDLGMDYLYKHDYKNAEKYFTEANELIPPRRGALWRFKTRALLGFGEISLAKGECAEALKLAEDSLSISEEAGARKYIAKSLKLKAEALAKMGNMEEAVKLMENALKLAQQLGNPPLTWQTHHSLGLLLEKQGDPRKASEHHVEALALIEKTASKLDDPSLKNTLLTAPMTNIIREHAII